MARKKRRKLPEQEVEVVIVGCSPKNDRVDVRLASRGPVYSMDADTARTLLAMLRQSLDRIDACPAHMKGAPPPFRRN